jgi:hypothetical protein
MGGHVRPLSRRPSGLPSLGGIEVTVNDDTPRFVHGQMPRHSAVR